MTILGKAQLLIDFWMRNGCAMLFLEVIKVKKKTFEIHLNSTHFSLFFDAKQQTTRKRTKLEQKKFLK